MPSLKKQRTSLTTDRMAGSSGSSIRNALSSAPWWVQDPGRQRLQRHHQRARQYGQQRPPQQRPSLAASFCHNLADLLRNVALHCYSKLLEPSFSIWERLIWLLVHMTTFFVLVTVLTLAWEAFVAQYVVINLHDPLYPIENVPFPAVAICSNNRISKDAASLYAKELSAKDPLTRPAEYFLERIASFVDLYQKYEEQYDNNKLLAFQGFLDVYDTWENETFFNVKRIIRRLTPNCTRLVLKCLLGGKEIECFGPMAFQESLTVYGPCCTFNVGNSYVRRTYQNRFANGDLGLTVMLNTSTDDDFAPILNSDGYIVIVHSPKTFPDATSGSTHEIYPTRGEESFLSIKARVIDTDPDLRSLGPVSRRCYFADEAPNRQNFIESSYSFANCITQCRIRSITALCRCSPFYSPLALVNRTNVIFCTLQHIACLKRYKYKWLNVLTQRVAVPGLERTMEDALFCPQCLPSCTDVQYELSLMSLPTARLIVSLNLQSLELRTNDSLNLEDMSVLRVYFGDQYAQYYRRSVGNTWYEGFSTVGNICSILLGFSLVAIGEIVYFLGNEIFGGLRHFVRQQRQQLREQKLQKHGSRRGNDGMPLYILP